MPGVRLVSLQVINWLCTAAEDQLRRHVTVADNLRAASAQLTDFSEFRATAEVSQSVVSARVHGAPTQPTAASQLGAA